MSDASKLKRAQNLVSDLRSIAEDVRSFSYETDAARMEALAREIDALFVVKRCEKCGQKVEP